MSTHNHFPIQAWPAGTRHRPCTTRLPGLALVAVLGQKTAEEFDQKSCSLLFGSVVRLSWDMNCSSSDSIHACPPCTANCLNYSRQCSPGSCPQNSTISTMTSTKEWSAEQDTWPMFFFAGMSANKGKELQSRTHRRVRCSCMLLQQRSCVHDHFNSN